MFNVRIYSCLYQVFLQVFRGRNIIYTPALVIVSGIGAQAPIVAAGGWRRGSEPLLRKRQDDAGLLDVHGMFSVDGVSGSDGVVAWRLNPPPLSAIAARS